MAKRAGADLIIHSEFRLTMQPRLTARGKQQIILILRDAMVGHVLRQIAMYVGAAIAARHPANYQALAAVWKEEPLLTTDLSGPIGFEIGNVAALNAAMPTRVSPGHHGGGAWRFGQWFNLEWGREFPSRTDSWIFQENPGRAASPKSPDNAPPGADYSDIEMSRWLDKLPSGRVMVHGRPGADFGVGPIREKQAAGLQPITAEDLLLTEIKSKRERDLIRGKKKTRVRSEHGLKGQGMFGAAPIRIGMVQGSIAVAALIPSMMREALAQLGKAG